MKIKFFDCLAGTTFSFRPNTTYDIIPGQHPHNLSDKDILRLVARGYAQPDGDEAQKEYGALAKANAKFLETAALR